MANDHKPCKSELDLNQESPLPLLSVAEHGLALEIFDEGVVIVGKSGIGKSELGLELIDRGHRLICDDLVAGKLHHNRVVISAPQEFGRGFMEIRGLGFINIKRMYGEDLICNQKNLSLVIQLVDNSILDLVNNNRLLQLISTVKVLGLTFPLYQLPIGANRNLPILVEMIVRYAKELRRGYDSHQAFINQQFEHLNQE